jgi:hypothetical protein
MRRAPANWPTDDTVITTRQLANLLSVTPATIRRWKGAGTGPPSYGRGAQTLYRCQDVKEWAVGNVRPSKHWKGLTTDPLHELDDRGRAILAAGRRAMIGLREEEREAVAKKTKRKIAARAHYFAAAGTNPGAFEHELTAGHGAIDAEFVELDNRAFQDALTAPDHHAPASQRQLVRAIAPATQSRAIGHGRPAVQAHAAGIEQSPRLAQSRGRDRQLLEELLALPRDARPAF